MNKNQLLEKERLEMAFKMLDKDGSGFVSAKELKDMMGNNQMIQESVWS